MWFRKLTGWWDIPLAPRHSSAVWLTSAPPACRTKTMAGYFIPKSDPNNCRFCTGLFNKLYPCALCCFLLALYFDANWLCHQQALLRFAGRIQISITDQMSTVSNYLLGICFLCKLTLNQEKKNPLKVTVNMHCSTSNRHSSKGQQDHKALSDKTWILFFCLGPYWFLYLLSTNKGLEEVCKLKSLFTQLCLVKQQSAGCRCGWAEAEQGTLLGTVQEHYF